MNTSTVIFAFFIQTGEGLGANAEEVVDISGDDRWADKLRAEAGCPDARVAMFQEKDWQSPRINTHSDIYTADVSKQVVVGIAKALMDSGVPNDTIMSLIESNIEILRLPISGRALLFVIYEGSASGLGSTF